MYIYIYIFRLQIFIVIVTCRPTTKLRDLSDFERGMVVGARRAGLSISKTADLLLFHAQTSLGFTENCPKKKK